MHRILTMLLSLAILSVVSHCIKAQGQSPLVDLFIGTQGSVPGTSYNGGNVFPGASLPFGAVKVGIDTTELVCPFSYSDRLTMLQI